MKLKSDMIILMSAIEATRKLQQLSVQLLPQAVEQLQSEAIRLEKECKQVAHVLLEEF